MTGSFVIGSPTWTAEPCIYYGNSSGDVTFDGGDQSHTLTGSSSALYCSSVESNTRSAKKKSKGIEPTQETGRIEMGDHSNQMLEYDNTRFYSWPTWTSKWKILPTSQKAYVREDLAVYCTGCGAKRKRTSHKFCPHCGTKF